MTAEQARTGWQKLIGNIDKYFHTPIVNTEEGTREFIISERKAWAFEMLNRVYGNMSQGEWCDYYHPCFYKGRIERCEFVDEENGRTYMMASQKYLNGNTKITLKIQ